MKRLLLAAFIATLTAQAPLSIVDLQAFRQTSTVHVRSRARDGTATLVNLNPAINAWYLLTVAWKESVSPELAWHLENANPRDTRILLDEKYPSGVVISQGAHRFNCELFDSALEQARDSRLIYYPLCGGRLYLRNPAKGHRTALEAATEFLRNQVWGGEQVIVLFHHLMADRYRETGEGQPGKHADAGASAGPQLASIDPLYSTRSLVPENLGIVLDGHGTETAAMTPGAWYLAAGNPGVYLSVIQPGLIEPSILRSYKNLVSNLDSVENSSLCYLIAFDLSRYELGYALGTEYPGVSWSDHMQPQMKDPHLPGPDGIGTIAPLVSTGLIAPENGRRTIATFTSGFKREHGAFRFGELAQKNHGSHYGFVENGVVFSKLQPGLATLVVLDDASLDMKTWTDADNKLLSRIRHARQNGVPIIEASAPGRLVASWGPGNWSGSEAEKLRTIRAGAALQGHFLIYAVFSDATPSAMARVFQAYHCSYAMLLDMNALEHTYLAVYRRAGSEMSVEHLIKGMSVLDKSASDEVVPRFLGYPDNRDFFYVMKRTEVKP